MSSVIGQVLIDSNSEGSSKTDSDSFNNTDEQEETISAEVLLKDPGNATLQFEKINQAASGLRELGFYVVNLDGELSIFGKPVLFERVFGMNLTVEHSQRNYSAVDNITRSIPRALSESIQDVLIVPKPEVFLVNP